MRFLLIAVLALSALGFAATNPHDIATKLANVDAKRKHDLIEVNAHYWAMGDRNSLKRDRAIQAVKDKHEAILNDLLEQADAARKSLLPSLKTKTAEDQKNDDGKTFKGMDPRKAADYLEKLA